MKYKKVIIIAIVLSVGIVALVISRSDSNHTDHDGHGHAQIEERDEREDNHEEEQAIELSQEQIAELGIELATATGGEVDVYMSLPGEITFNANKLAHIVPTVPGIVRQVVKDIGDTVVAGEIIAWIESTKVGGAKLDYLAKQSEVSCCSIEFVRAKEIYDNTLKLLETLNDSPSLETLRKMTGSAMGKNRSLLVSSYAELIFTRESYLREKDLYEKKISSKDDFLKAQRSFNKANAEYVAMRDSINYEVKRDLLEARRAQQIREIELQAALRLLYLHGLTAKDVENLSSLAKNQNSQVSQEEDCDDPNCTECLAKSATKGQDTTSADIRIANEKIAWYPIRSPFKGTITNKHITLGEFVTEASDILIVADLSSVWVDLHVYHKDLMTIKKGQRAVISAGQMIPDTEGAISYVGPVVGAESRTALARVVLPNSTGVFRPGLFVTAKVAIDNVEADVIVGKDAVQTLDGKKCVFIKDSHGFEPSFITLGQSNTDFIQVTSGLKPGQQYVTKGAFDLKAKIVTSTLDSHAGHGH
ncbi:MAG: efflux RND transporter periplasmic adaptor subunit [Deltaproteobacteria bacterium]|nr:efflux RND transporter periplasmic adaptor subunit [Deltaproteobacteria bacterium]